MGGILDTLHLGSSGIGAARRGMHVTGENITNINTPGYHRRQVIMEPAPPIQREGVFQLGSGVRASTVQRVVDGSLDARVRDARAQQGFDTAQSSILSRTDAYFQDLDGNGVLPALDELLSAFDMLSTAPHQVAYRQEVLHSASALANQLNQKGFQLRSTQDSLNDQVLNEVDIINDKLKTLADINQKLRTQTGPANSLLDRQAQALDELSDHIGIKVYDQPGGVIEVHTSSGFALILGHTAKELSVSPDINGRYRVMGTDGGGTHDLSSKITSGELGGVLSARDVELQDTLDRLNDFATDFANAVNNIHAAGYGLDGDPLDPTIGTGRNLFDLTPGQDAAEGIRLSVDVAGNADAVAAAASNTLLPGDNTNALLLRDLRTAPLVGTENAVENLRNVLSDFGARVYEASHNAAASVNAHTGVAEVQQSVSGVSLDEEMVSLLSYQQQFSAAAQIVRAVDEILQEVIALKR